MRDKRQIFKLSVVAGFSFIWFLIALGRVQRPVRLRWDVDFLVSLAATFQQGSISGRDFHYTYGPVAQALAWAGAALHSRNSALDGYPLSVLVWYVTAFVLFGAIMMCLGTFGPLETALVYLASIPLDLLGWFPFTDVASFRVLFVLLSVTAVGKSLGSETVSARRAWGVTGGLLCIAGQLTTIELGIWAVTASAALCIGYIGWSGYGRTWEDARRHLQTLSTVMGISVGGNLLISALFRISGDGYSFFDYQHYALETIAGYVYGSSLPWQLGRWETAGLAVVILYTVAAVWAVQGKLNPQDRAVLLGMTIASVLFLKNALTRSEDTHIQSALTPMVLVFLLLGRWVLSELGGPRFGWKHATVWAAVLGLLFLSWPTYATPFDDLKRGAESLATGGIEALRHAETRPEDVLPAEFIDALRDSGPKPILNFPSENYVGVLLNRPLVAPVLQSFAANTTALQKYYVESLEKSAGGDFDVNYNLDKLTASPVDEVQTISRNPIIFEYLYRNFEPRLYAGGRLVLRRRAVPRDVQWNDLVFQTIRRGPDGVEIRVSEPTHCGLLRLEIQVAYPIITALLKPATIRVRLLNETQEIVHGVLVPLAVGQPFHTFLSAVPPQHFSRVFEQEQVPSPAWDRLIIGWSPSDWLSISPSRLEISRLSCMDSARFSLLNQERTSDGSVAIR